MTEETCSSCGTVTTRKFEDGDTVFGAGKKCPKCGSSDTLVTAVYSIVPANQQKK